MNLEKKSWKRKMRITVHVQQLTFSCYFYFIVFYIGIYFYTLLYSVTSDFSDHSESSVTFPDSQCFLPGFAVVPSCFAAASPPDSAGSHPGFAAGSHPGFAAGSHPGFAAGSYGSPS